MFGRRVIVGLMDVASTDVGFQGLRIEMEYSETPAAVGSGDNDGSLDSISTPAVAQVFRMWTLALPMQVRASLTTSALTLYRCPASLASVHAHGSSGPDGATTALRSSGYWHPPDASSQCNANATAWGQQSSTVPSPEALCLLGFALTNETPSAFVVGVNICGRIVSTVDLPGRSTAAIQAVVPTAILREEEPSGDDKNATSPQHTWQAGANAVADSTPTTSVKVTPATLRRQLEALVSMEWRSGHMRGAVPLTLTDDDVTPAMVRVVSPSLVRMSHDITVHYSAERPVPASERVPATDTAFLCKRGDVLRVEICVENISTLGNTDPMVLSVLAAQSSTCRQGGFSCDRVQSHLSARMC